MRSFDEWRAVVIVRLSELKEKYKGNRDAERDIEYLMGKIETTYINNIAEFLVRLYASHYDIPEILKLMPTEEEIEAWFKQEYLK
jgi:hypothetical protein